MAQGWTRAHDDRVDRILRRIVGVIVAAPLLAIAATYVYDEPLSADAKALTVPPPEVAPDERNAFVYFLGMSASAGEDVYAQGVKALDELRAQNRPGAEAIAAQEQTIARMRAAIGDLTSWCRPEETSCLGAVATDRSLAGLLQQYGSALERYRTLREKPEYLELHVPATFESPVLIYRPLIESQSLSILDITLKLNAGEVDLALSELERNFAFHRRMCAGSRTLIGKLIASTMLARDVLLLSDILRTKGESIAAYHRRLAVMLRPLTPEESDLTEVMRIESGYLVSSLAGEYPKRSADTPFDGVPFFLVRAVYKPNATANLIARQHRVIAPIFMDTRTPFESAEVEAKSNLTPGILFTRMDRLVNATGVLVAEKSAVNNHFNYVARIRDVQALLVLAGLQIALYEAGASTSESVATALAGDLGKSFANPHTGGPMEYDAKANAIYFRPNGNGRWSNSLVRRFDGRIALEL